MLPCVPGAVRKWQAWVLQSVSEWLEDGAEGEMVEERFVCEKNKRRVCEILAQMKVEEVEVVLEAYLKVVGVSERVHVEFGCDEVLVTAMVRWLEWMHSKERGGGGGGGGGSGPFERLLLLRTLLACHEVSFCLLLSQKNYSLPASFLTSALTRSTTRSLHPLLRSSAPCPPALQSSPRATFSLSHPPSTSVFFDSYVRWETPPPPTGSTAPSPLPCSPSSSSSQPQSPSPRVALHRPIHRNPNHTTPRINRLMTSQRRASSADTSARTRPSRFASFVSRCVATSRALPHPRRSSPSSRFGGPGHLRSSVQLRPP